MMHNTAVLIRADLTAAGTADAAFHAARDVALKALCQREHNLTKELPGLLGPDDPAVPAKVLNVVVTPLGAGEMEVDWDPSANADRYHVEILVGAETEFQRVATVFDTGADSSGLAPVASAKMYPVGRAIWCVGCKSSRRTTSNFSPHRFRR